MAGAMDWFFLGMAGSNNFAPLPQNAIYNNKY